MKLVNKIENKIENWLTRIISKAVLDTKIEDRVRVAIEKLRYDYLPHGACWMCSMPVSRSGGYSMWKGKMFCTDNCFEKYRSLIQLPNESYRYIEGEPVEVFKPNK